MPFFCVKVVNLFRALPFGQVAWPTDYLAVHRRRTLTVKPVPSLFAAITGSLPEGSTAEGLYNSRMAELANSVVDLGKSTSLPCDQGGAVSGRMGEEGVGSPAAGMGAGLQLQGGHATLRRLPPRVQYSM